MTIQADSLQVPYLCFSTFAKGMKVIDIKAVSQRVAADGAITVLHEVKLRPLSFGRSAPALDGLGRAHSAASSFGA